SGLSHAAEAVEMGDGTAPAAPLEPVEPGPSDEAELAIRDAQSAPLDPRVRRGPRWLRLQPHAERHLRVTSDRPVVHPRSGDRTRRHHADSAPEPDLEANGNSYWRSVPAPRGGSAPKRRNRPATRCPQSLDRWLDTVMAATSCSAWNRRSPERAPLRSGAAKFVVRSHRTIGVLHRRRRYAQIFDRVHLGKAPRCILLAIIYRYLAVTQAPRETLAQRHRIRPSLRHYSQATGSRQPIIVTRARQSPIHQATSEKVLE